MPALPLGVFLAWRLFTSVLLLLQEMLLGHTQSLTAVYALLLATCRLRVLSWVSQSAPTARLTLPQPPLPHPHQAPPTYPPSANPKSPSLMQPHPLILPVQRNCRGFIDLILSVSVLVARASHTPAGGADNPLQLKPECPLIGRKALGKADWVMLYRTLAVVVAEVGGRTFVQANVGSILPLKGRRSGLCGKWQMLLPSSGTSSIAELNRTPARGPRVSVT